jgi:hypothetical protein
MPHLWSLRGLSCRELARRTSRKSWDGEIFGQAVSSAFLILLVLFWVGLPQRARAQQSCASVPVVNIPLGGEQVVENLVGMNLERAQALHAYHVSETYRLKYRGFLGARNAEMVVDAKYQSPGTETFTIQSATGSKAILNKVFKKLLRAEDEVLGAETQRRAALNRNNYEFALVGCESTPSGSTYVLRVTPRRKDKFLYRGRIWVNAQDFAVVRVEAEPAKHLSFWVRSTEFDRRYEKVDHFWLPANTQSVSRIRFGGHAELTIQYANYLITSHGPVGNLPVTDRARTAGTMGAHPARPQARAQAAKE